MRAGLYARVSTEEQATGGYSLDAQLEAMRRYTAAQGWTVAGEYVDPGLSGSDSNRPAFCQMMADAEDSRLDVVMVHKLDRFFRYLKGQLNALEQLAAWGVAFVSVLEAIDFSTPAGKLFQIQLGGFNEFYLDNLRQETRKGKRGRAKAGKTNASIAPYGYSRDGKGRIRVDAEAAQTVALAFETYATGSYSDMGVAGLLNQAGRLPSTRADSGRWTREAVRYMLTNPFYVGQVRYGPEVLPGSHQGLIDAQVWERVQAIRRQRGAGKGGGRRAERMYLLQGLARCHRCGLPLVAQTYRGRDGKERPYLRDVADRRGADCADGGRSVRTEPLDDQIGRLVQALVLPPDWRDRVIELIGRQDEAQNRERERARLAEKLRRLRRAYLEVEIDEATYRREKAEAQARLEALAVPEQNQILDAGRFLETLAGVWAEATPAERCELLRLLLQGVVVDVAGRKVVCVRPRGAFVALFRQVPGLLEDDGCFYLAESEGIEYNGGTEKE